jgi:site-specific recombinase XerD
MRALSTYLGHANVADTYWYLQVTPRLVRDVADACESFLEGGER